MIRHIFLSFIIVVSFCLCKAQSEDKIYQLESLTFIGKNKKCIEVDENQNVVADSSYKWDDKTSAWIKSSKFLYYYNNNTLTSYTMSYWDIQKSNWCFERKEEYTFDEKKNKTNEKVLMYINNEWILKEHREYQYDKKGNEIYASNIISSPSGTNIHANYKYEKKYDNNNLIEELCSKTKKGETNYYLESKNVWTYKKGTKSSLVEYKINNDTLVEFSKTEYQYNTNGKDSLKFIFKWDHVKKDWNYHKKEMYSYTERGKIANYNDWFWDKSSGKWIADVMKNNSFDENGKRTLHIVNFWNKNKNKWEGNYKRIYSYDIFGNTLSIADQRMDKAAGIWKDNYVKNYTYDIRIPLNSVIQKNEGKLKKTKPIHAITSEKLFDWDERTKTWKLHESWKFNYSEF